MKNTNSTIGWISAGRANFWGYCLLASSNKFALVIFHRCAGGFLANKLKIIGNFFTQSIKIKVLNTKSSALTEKIFG